jgi:hypothetical protein
MISLEFTRPHLVIILELSWVHHVICTPNVIPTILAKFCGYPQFSDTPNYTIIPIYTSDSSFFLHEIPQKTSRGSCRARLEGPADISR